MSQFQSEDARTTIVLEQSTNTHAFVGKPTAKATRYPDGSVFVSEPGVVTHGEHGVIATEKPVYKVNQTEVNPVTSALQHAFD